jgi:hypothetical protein
VLVPVRRGHRVRGRPPETPETHVWLMTQRRAVDCLRVHPGFCLGVASTAALWPPGESWSLVGPSCPPGPHVHTSVPCSAGAIVVLPLPLNPDRAGPEAGCPGFASGWPARAARRDRDRHQGVDRGAGPGRALPARPQGSVTAGPAHPCPGVSVRIAAASASQRGHVRPLGDSRWRPCRTPGRRSPRSWPGS